MMLWVQECWGLTAAENRREFEIHEVLRGQADLLRRDLKVAVHYRATEQYPGMYWRPSTTMPRSASRITLEVVDVRGQQVQAITEADIIAEGIESLGWHWAASGEEGVGSFLYWNRGVPPPEPWMSSCETADDIYRWLWDSENVKRGPAFCFAANPWVWSGEVRRLSDG